MMNSNNLSKPPLLLTAPRSINVWLGGGAIISALGFLDALFLTLRHYLGGALPCVLTTGCETVTTSSYSLLWGWPIALFGAAYYLCLLAGYNRRWFRFNFGLTAVGLLASAYLVYVQFFVLRALCFYCLVSAGFTVALFVLNFFLLRFAPDDSL